MPPAEPAGNPTQIPAHEPVGLSSAEARQLLARHGANTLPTATRERWWRGLLRQFRGPLIYVLLFALLVEVGGWLFGREAAPLEALAIAVILLLNAVLGFWQERKAENALEELTRLAAPRAWVIRDGHITRRPSAELVPGDVVRCESGDRVPADAILLEPASVLLDESILTGESLPIEKAGDNEIYAGTLLVRGLAYARITRTGLSSAMGHLVYELAAVRPEPTPLERRMNAFGARVARWVLVLAAIIALGGLATEGTSEMGRILVFAVALAVAAVPEGLPAILTLALTLGVQRMARRNAVVRKLSAVEALGSVTVIATDKTGTLTSNQIEVRELDSPDRERAMRAMAFANDADASSGAGDPLELALLRFAQSSAGNGGPTRTGLEMISLRPFDSVTRFMRITVRESEATVSYLKGAPETLLERSTLSTAERDQWRRRIEDAAAGGHRLIAFAWAPGERETDLQWLGLALLWDPPREGVRAALQEAREAGIRIVMVTGDHGATAVAIANTLGLDSGRVVTGAELEAMTADQRRLAATESNIFARVSPSQKLAIVEALKDAGEIVAVTGDGVNDAPALKRADVGIAMGQRGSDVSREVADLVLLDDNFSTIVAAVEEGRNIYANIQKFIRFLFSTNLSEVLVVVIGALAAFSLDLRDSAGNLLLPLTAAQLLWINLVTDGAPALALTLDRNPGLMRQPPRPASAPLLDRSSLQFIGGTGMAKAGLALLFLYLLPRMGYSLDMTRSAVFVLLACGQLLFVYPARRTVPASLRNWLLHLAVMTGFVAQWAVVQIPGLARAFQAVALTPAVWLAVIATTVVAWAAAELVSALIRASRLKTFR